MKRQTALIAGFIFLLMAAFPFMANGQPRFGVRMEFGGGPGPVSRLYVDLGNYYHVPYADIWEMHNAGICDEDIPVILYIHAHSPYTLRQIYRYRVRGESWDRISAWSRIPLRTYDRERDVWRDHRTYGNDRNFGRDRYQNRTEDRRFSDNHRFRNGDRMERNDHR